jgi:SAM-dependent methyltransferase
MLNGDQLVSTGSKCPACASLGSDVGRTLGGYSLVTCDECGLVFAPRALGEEVDYAAIYDTDAYRRDQIDRLRLSTDVESTAACATYRSFFRRVRPAVGALLLDVGCGVGRFCRAAAACGWSVRGIDVSPSAIAIGREHSDVELECTTISEVVERGLRFDVVTAFEVLEHLADPGAFLSLCRSVLVPGGRMFCTVPNWECEEVSSTTRPDWVPPVHKLFFGRAALEVVALAAGLSDVRVGAILTDPLPARPKSLPKWLVRRLVGRRRVPLGLWLSARRGRD